MDVFDKDLISNLAEQARNSERLRVNYLIHKSKEEKCQRLLDVLQPGTIFPIHKHTIEETLFILKGEIDIIYCDNNGKEAERCTLSQETGIYGVRIEPGVWHTLEVKKPDTVMIEIKDGPFNPSVTIIQQLI